MDIWNKWSNIHHDWSFQCLFQSLSVEFLTITMASKSRSTLVLIILLPSMLGLLGICTYSTVISSNLLDPKYAYYHRRYLTSYGEKRTSFNTSWDAMMKSVMNCGGSLEEDTSNNRVIYLCTEDYRWSRCYSNYDSKYCQRCQTFSLDQDDFCNGVFDFPLNETKLRLQHDNY